MNSSMILQLRVPSFNAGVSLAISSLPAAFSRAIISILGHKRVSNDVRPESCRRYAQCSFKAHLQSLLKCPLTSLNTNSPENWEWSDLTCKTQKCTETCPTSKYKSRLMGNLPKFVSFSLAQKSKAKLGLCRDMDFVSNFKCLPFSGIDWEVLKCCKIKFAGRQNCYLGRKLLPTIILQMQ